MKRLLLLLCAVVLGFALAPPAQAATGVVSNGIAWTMSPSGATDPQSPVVAWCTMGVVGRDSSGNPVGVSAGHCVRSSTTVQNLPDGAPVYRYIRGSTAPRQQIGVLAHSDRGLPENTAVDYSVIRFNSDAILTSNGPGARIDGKQALQLFFPPVCKDGFTTGVTCGAAFSQSATRFQAFVYAGGGDSGGPAFQNNTKIVGMVRGPAEFIRFDAVFNAINAQPNPVGKNLVITNSP